MFLSMLFFSLAALGADAPATTTFYVAPNGSDSAAGNLEAPFATLERAQAAARDTIAAGLTQPIAVELRQGAYSLTEALEFGPEDGGTEAFSVTYRAFEGEQVAVSGGRAITGWKKAKSNQWTVEIPEAAQGAWAFRQLFRDGERLPRGRFPNAPELLRVSGVSEDLTGIVLSTAPGVDNLAGSNAELVMYQNWSISRVLVDSSSQQTLKMKNPMGWMGHGDMTSASTNKPTYIENALAFVDAPGEWYLDYATGLLTYQAEEGEDPNARSFIAPVANQLIKVQGSPEQPVRNLHFEGLTFEHTHWSLPDFGYLGIQAGHHGTTIKDPTYVLPLALQFVYTESCGIRRCLVARMGACGIGFGAGTRRNRVEQCTFEDIGGNGIMVGWRGLGEMARQTEDEDGYLAADWANPGDVPIENTVTGNLVQRCAAVNHGCVGIFDAFAQSTAITHNVVRDMPYTGISAGFRWNESGTSQRGGLIAYNHVYDTMKMLADGGCLYTLGSQPGAVILGNVFHMVHRSEYAHGGAPNNGIFFDQGSKGFHVEGNTIYDTSGEPIRFNQCGEDSMTWKDNQLGVGR
jgi:hypothetical protein